MPSKKTTSGIQDTRHVRETIQGDDTKGLNEYGPLRQQMCDQLVFELDAHREFFAQTR